MTSRERGTPDVPAAGSGMAHRRDDPGRIRRLAARLRDHGFTTGLLIGAALAPAVHAWLR